MNMPLIFWPSQTVIIDDNSLFLNELKILLDKHQFKNCKYFSDSKEAINYINEQPVDINNYISVSDPNSFGNINCTIDYGIIPTIHRSKHKSNIISNVIVDHNMPHVTGLELCNKISNPYIRKTLLTSVLDHQIAVNNLNAKNIDSFFNKQDLINFSNFIDIVRNEQKLFFNQLCKIIVEAIKLHNNNHHIFTHQYKGLLYNLIQKNNIEEYYLLNEEGWFLLIDRNNTKYCFFIFEQEAIDEMAKEADVSEINHKYYKNLCEYKQALCYYDIKNKSWPHPALWKDYISNVTGIIINDQQYYYSLLPLDERHLY